MRRSGRSSAGCCVAPGAHSFGELLDSHDASAWQAILKPSGGVEVFREAYLRLPAALAFYKLCRSGWAARAAAPALRMTWSSPELRKP